MESYSVKEIEERAFLETKFCIEFIYLIKVWAHFHVITVLFTFLFFNNRLDKKQLPKNAFQLIKKFHVVSLVALGHNKIKKFFSSLSYLHTWRILLLYCTHTLAIRFLALNKWPLRVHIMNCKQSNINSHSWQHVPIIDLTVCAYYEWSMWILLGPFGTHLDVGFKINLCVWYRWLISIGSTDFYACRDKKRYGFTLILDYLCDTVQIPYWYVLYSTD